MESVYETLQNYREAAIGAQDPDPAKANVWAARLQTFYEVLRQTEEGKNGILSFLTDDDPYVRLWAAAHALQWAPDAARRVLERLRDSDGPGAFDAKWTLIEFEKGRLTFDHSEPNSE